MNPNNCETCDHINENKAGHCYMFKDEPIDICYQHTGRNIFKTFKPNISGDLLETFFQLMNIIE